MVAVYWLDICSDSSWQSIEGCKKAKLPVCVTKGHLLTQKGGITRIFGDYSLADEELGKIEEIGNTTIIPNSVIVEIKKISLNRIDENILFNKTNRDKIIDMDQDFLSISNKNNILLWLLCNEIANMNFTNI